MKIGILGTGHIGSALAMLLTRAGHDVIVGSRHPSKHNQLAHDLSELGQGRVEQDENAMAHGDVVIDALPFKASMKLDDELLEGKLLITAANYYRHRDGEIELDGLSEAEAIAKRLPKVRVAKAFNMMPANEFRHNYEGRQGDRLGVLFAADADHPQDVSTVSKIIDDAGFDSVHTGGLSTGFAFQPGTPAYGTLWTATEMRDKLRL